MRKIRDILRLRHEGGLSIRQIKASTKVSIGAIQKLLARAKTLRSVLEEQRRFRGAKENRNLQFVTITDSSRSV